MALKMDIYKEFIKTLSLPASLSLNSYQKCVLTVCFIPWTQDLVLRKLLSE